VRLFVGVELEEAVAERAANAALALRQRLADVAPRFVARWGPAANLHITLWFIGEVPEPRAEAVAEALRPRLDLPAFRLAIGGCGAYPPSGAPRVLWIGAGAGTGEMQALYARIGARLTPLGCAAERRPYSPHLTIARVKDPGPTPPRALRQTMASVPAECGESGVKAVTLFRSRLSPRGPAYDPLLRVPLS
jgi:2'-5' RNA ligase